jgi:hypothetical protein
MPSTVGVDRRLENVPAAVLDALTLSPGATYAVATHPPVVALTLTRDQPSRREVLVCVRDSETNVTHPDVLSSPTARVRQVVTTGDVLAIPGDGGPPAWLIQTCEQILEHKLGVKDVDVAGRVRHTQVWQGNSVIGRDKDGGILTEALTMINVLLDLSDLADQLPPTTSAYREIHWIPEADHRIMTEMRNAAATGVQFRDPAPLVYGLCTQSTAAMLAATPAASAVSAPTQVV